MKAILPLNNVTDSILYYINILNSVTQGMHIYCALNRLKTKINVLYIKMQIRKLCPFTNAII